METCLGCGAKWLRYFVEYPAFTASGRWCRGKVTDKDLDGVTAETALSVIESLDCYEYGGSYFKTASAIGKGPFWVDS